MLVLNTNLKIVMPDGQTRGTTQFINYGFNSFARIGDRYLAANDDGLFDLTGDTDNGEKIQASMELPTSDFGIGGKKRARFFYVGFESDGQLILRTSADQEPSRDYVVKPSKPGQQGVRVTAGRNQKGRYWQVSVHNRDGADFSIDKLQALFVALSQGIGRN